jgi:hypothetical protein
MAQCAAPIVPEFMKMPEIMSALRQVAKKRAGVAARLLAMAVLTAVTLQSATAGHIDTGAYPYASEITILLSAQEKFYLVDPENASVFREATTTRMAAYRIWGTGLLSTQNEPDSDDPHGPLKSLGLLVHEMGHNRGGESTIVLMDGDVLRFHQHTTLVAKGGKHSPDVKLDVDIQMRGAKTESVIPGRRVLRPTERGQKDFRTALEAMAVRLTKARRKEIDEELAANGLKLIPGTERIEMTYPGTRTLGVVIDPVLGAARVRLPDVQIVLFARIEQSYAEGENNDQG